MAELRIRNTARAVMLDPVDRVLLFEFHIPAGMMQDEPRRFWATPGGAIEPGEDVLDALVREVREETGIVDFEPGPELWYGSNELSWDGERFKTLERFFLVRSRTTTLDTGKMTQLERDIMRAHRWWATDELINAQVTIFPPRFGYLVDEYLRHGAAGPREIPL